MNRRTKIKFPVYGYEVIVIQARDVEVTGKRLKVDFSNTEAGFVTDPAQPMKVWLIFGQEPDNATIGHEASHAVRAMLLSVGAKPDDDEAFAYHLGYVIERLHKFLRRKK
jgi:ribosomal protein L13